MLPATILNNVSCIESTYLTSINNKPLVDNDNYIRLIPDPNSELTEENLQAGYNRVEIVTGTLKKSNCFGQKNCDCESYILVNSLRPDDEKTKVLATSKNGVAGELSCLYDDDNNCIFIIKSILDGKNYELVDMGEQSGMGQFKAGQKIKAYGEIIQGNSFDTATISGSIYLVKAEAF